MGPDIASGRWPPAPTFSRTHEHFPRPACLPPQRRRPARNPGESCAMAAYRWEVRTLRKYRRKTNPAVVNGQVRKKNRTERSDVYHAPPDGPILERWKPGFGYRHVLRLRDV